MKSTFGKKIYSNKLLDLNELIFLVPSLRFSDLSSPSWYNIEVNIAFLVCWLHG